MSVNDWINPFFILKIHPPPHHAMQRYTHQDHNPHRKEKRQAFNLSFALLWLFFQIKWVYWCYLVTTVYWHICIYSESTLIDVMAVVMMIRFICHHHRWTCWVNWKEEITLRESFKLELYNLIVKFLLWLGSPTALTSREAYKIDEGLTKN